MKCLSTRGKAPAVSLREAVIAGIAPDGGLYVPASIERKPESWWKALRGKSFQDVAIAVMNELAGDEFDRETIASLVREALNFPVRVVELEKGLGVLELFHGPTFAFKDFGARMLAQMVTKLNAGGAPITILVATSGDTGSAVAHAFFDVPDTRVVVLYPEGQVSAVQEAQFATLGGNVTAVAVGGTFDDCQRLAKEAFVDPQLSSRVRLTSANSISLGRLLPQVFYYAYAALQYEGNTPLRVSVPSGNFGNLVAGVMAWKLGAPINQFARADDDQRHLASLSGIGTRRAEELGVDPGQCDGCRQSQQSRTVAWLFGNDVAAVRKLVISEPHRDDDVKRAISTLYQKYAYIADPHSAIGYRGCSKSTNCAVPGDGPPRQIQGSGRAADWQTGADAGCAGRRPLHARNRCSAFHRGLRSCRPCYDRRMSSRRARTLDDRSRP